MRIIYKFLLLAFSILLVFSCVKEVKKIKAKLPNTAVYFPLPKKVRAPSNNPMSQEKIDLGKLLFYDPILSGNKDVACVTCHHPDFGYAEFRDLSIGVNGVGLSGRRRFKSPNDIPIVKRNANTVLNTAYNGMQHNGSYDPEDAPMFWDSRENSLEAQALAPLKALEEMKGADFSEEEILDTLVNRLKNIPEYVALFEAAFPAEEAVTSDNIAKSIASFERTLASGNSRFDQFLAGDSEALSLGEKDGFELFKSAGCNNCHSGPMFSDFKMHVLGVPDNEKLEVSDDGFEKTYAFRTPSLRNLRYTAPYMHNGKLKELKDVLEFYEDISSGISKNPHVPNEKIDSLARKIKIKVKDMGSIISFFNSLNDVDFDKEIPERVPSNLPVGGNIQ